MKNESTRRPPDIPQRVADEILYESDRTCCICQIKEILEDFKKLLASRMNEIYGSCGIHIRNWFYGLAVGSEIDAVFVDVNYDRSELVFRVGDQKHTVQRGKP